MPKSHLCRRFAVLLATGLLCLPSPARSDTCPTTSICHVYDHDVLAAGLHLVGNATFDSITRIVTLTQDATGRAGALMNDRRFCASDDFFHLYAAINVDTQTTDGADGIAVVLFHNDDPAHTIGSSGPGIGYGGILNSIVVEFDTHQDAVANDPNDNHVAIMLDGSYQVHTMLYSIDPYAEFSLKAGSLQIWIDYEMAVHRLEVFAAPAGMVKPTDPFLTYYINLAAVFPAGFYAGVTAATNQTDHSLHQIPTLLAGGTVGPSDICCNPGLCNNVARPMCDTERFICEACDGNYGDPANSPCFLPSQPLCGGDGLCYACDSNAGGGGTHPCSPSAPNCNPDGSCSACDDDYPGGPGSTHPCPVDKPSCDYSGVCLYCATSWGEGGGFACSWYKPVCSTGLCHLCDGSWGSPTAFACPSVHPYCDVAGNCSSHCQADADCFAGQWCDWLAGDPGCASQLANGDQLPHSITCADLALYARGACQAGLLCDDEYCVSCLTSDNTGCSGMTPICAFVVGHQTACFACNGNYGSGADKPCPAATPYCELTHGSCDTVAYCLDDAHCPADQWCNNLATPPYQCQDKIANGVSLPGGASCDPALGTRACLSGACWGDNACGIPIGQSLCAPSAPVSQCREGVCIDSGTWMYFCKECASNADCSGLTPICDSSTNGCVSCAGDRGTATDRACWSPDNPYCHPNGACGRCTSSADCVVGAAVHGGPVCNLASGACGTSCTDDDECAPDGWCDAPGAEPGDGVCATKLADGQPCDRSVQCLTGVCEQNLCGGVMPPDMQLPLHDMAQPTVTDGGVVLADMTRPDDAETPTGGNHITVPSFEGGGLTCSLRRHGEGTGAGDGLALLAFAALALLARRRWSR